MIVVGVVVVTHSLLCITIPLLLYVDFAPQKLPAVFIRLHLCTDSDERFTGRRTSTAPSEEN